MTYDQVWWPILRICALHLTHPRCTHTAVNTHWSSTTIDFVLFHLTSVCVGDVNEESRHFGLKHWETQNVSKLKHFAPFVLFHYLHNYLKYKTVLFTMHRMVFNHIFRGDNPLLCHEHQKVWPFLPVPVEMHHQAHPKCSCWLRKVLTPIPSQYWSTSHPSCDPWFVCMCIQSQWATNFHNNKKLR